MSGPTSRVVVIGGGITGLSLAFTIREEARALGAGVDVMLLEAAPTPGGHARTIAEDGFLVETGPNGFLDREPETLALVAALGLESRLIGARPEARRRYIVRDGRLCRVPDSPRTLLTSDALTLRGKLRLLWEPFARRARRDVDESVYDFARRRIGREAADMLVDAAVAGISAGDSRALSVRAHFPLMAQMERDHGSLIRAVIARRTRGVKPSRLLGFDGGMTTLVGTLTERLSDAIRVRAAVRHLERRAGEWRVHTERGDVLAADRVVLATSARVAAGAVSGIDPQLAALLGRIPFAGVTLVALGYRLADVPRPLDGYGYLVTRPERLATLGVVWESSLFPGRAPAGMALFRVILGGARRPDLARTGSEAAASVARDELQRVLGIHALPVRTWTFGWPDAIAQYTVGHAGRVDAIRARLGQHDGLDVCGTSYDGASFNHAIAAARRAGRSLAARLADEQRTTRSALPTPPVLASL